MSRLVVNPGTPQAWEIQLKPGTNLLGRGFANDFRLEDSSISSSHCEIVVNDGSVFIRDLGSTNGTFINRSPVQEAKLEPGQLLHLGRVPIAFHTDEQKDVPETATVPVAPAPGRPSIRLASSASVAKTVEMTQPPLPPPVMPQEGVAATTFVQAGPRFCKFHPRSPARYLCTKCNRTFCDLCVVSRTTGATVKKNCRSCGVECVPVQTQRVIQGEEKGFFSRLPGALLYPFQGSGVMVFVVVTVLVTGLEILRKRSFIYYILLSVVTYGYIFLYMQSIIHATAAGDEEMPPMPSFDGLVGAFFRLLITVLVSFSLLIALEVTRLFDVPIPPAALIAAALLGCLYFPMAFLAVAMMDSFMSANPLVVIPSILKVPGAYAVTAILFGVIYGADQLGEILIGLFGRVDLSTRDMSKLFIGFAINLFWSFLSMYLLTINMRVLGLLYLTKKRELGWFSR